MFLSPIEALSGSTASLVGASYYVEMDAPLGSLPKKELTSASNFTTSLNGNPLTHWSKTSR